MQSILVCDDDKQIVEAISIYFMKTSHLVFPLWSPSNGF